jgi:hypothetical protein
MLFESRHREKMCSSTYQSPPAITQTFVRSVLVINPCIVGSTLCSSTLPMESCPYSALSQSGTALIKLKKANLVLSAGLQALRIAA